MARRSRRRWIQRAIKRPGSLTNWFYSNRRKLKRKLGYDPITKKGDINDRAIYGTIRLVKQGKLRVDKKTLRRLYLARTLRRMRELSIFVYCFRVLLFLQLFLCQ